MTLDEKSNLETLLHGTPEQRDLHFATSKLQPPRGSSAGWNRREGDANETHGIPTHCGYPQDTSFSDVEDKLWSSVSDACDVFLASRGIQHLHAHG